MCGYGKYGRLGLRDERNVFKPSKLTTMIGTPVVAAECGELFTVMLTSNGDCYTCGVIGTSADEYVQNPSAFQVPHLVEFLSGQSVCCIAAGVTHLVAIIAPNEIYSWGSDVTSPDGVGGSINGEPEHYLCTIDEDDDDIPPPQLVHVACGSSHTVVMSGDGNVWAWGRSKFGQLGTGKFVDSLSPTLINTFEPDQVPVLISAGGSSCSVLTESRASDDSITRSTNNTCTGKAAEEKDYNSRWKNKVQKTRGSLSSGVIAHKKQVGELAQLLSQLGDVTAAQQGKAAAKVKSLPPPPGKMLPPPPGKMLPPPGNLPPSSLALAAVTPPSAALSAPPSGNLGLSSSSSPATTQVSKKRTLPANLKKTTPKPLPPPPPPPIPN
jgi:hypothetical protein